MDNSNLVSGLGGSSDYGEVTMTRGTTNFQVFDFTPILGDTFAQNGEQIGLDRVSVHTSGLIQFQNTTLGHFGVSQPPELDDDYWIAPNYFSWTSTRSRDTDIALVHIDRDAAAQTVTVTWDRMQIPPTDWWFEGPNTNVLSSFQVQMHLAEDGSFEVTTRYGDVDVIGRLAGYSLGEGNSYSNLSGLAGQTLTDWTVSIAQDSRSIGTRNDDDLGATSGVDVNDIMFGGGGDDTIRGFEGDDTLLGGAGADSLIGGAGRDMAAYSFAQAGVLADLADSMQNAGFAAGDSYTTIEALSGSGHADTLSGDAGDNVLRGRSGDDVLSGRGGGDTLNGGYGDDVLMGDDGDDDIGGGAGDDVLRGGAGDDTMRGGDGNDLFFGGAGADIMMGSDYGRFQDVNTVSYADMDGPVRVSLSFEVQEDFNGLNAEGDILRNIDNLIGTGSNDNLRGDWGDNEISGGAGNDWMHGSEGNDTLRGGGGDDRIFGGAEDDLLIGGAGADTFELFADRGSDTIEDFTLGVDTLRIGWHFAGQGPRPDAPASVAEYLSSAVVVDGNLVIDSGTGGIENPFYNFVGFHNTLTLLGVTDIDALAQDIVLY